MAKMGFGDSVKPAETASSAEWLADSQRREPGTVGSLIPDLFERLLRVRAPAARSDDWWSDYRDLFKTVSLVGEAHTSTPDLAWFAIWEGHGFDTVSTNVAWGDIPVDETERELERKRLREQDRHHNAAIASELAQIPRFSRPDRTYYLLEGPVGAVTEFSYPTNEGWRNPDLFWPTDRSWFVATDVDFWSLYVGGSDSLISELVETLGALCEPVEIHHKLLLED